MCMLFTNTNVEEENDRQARRQAGLKTLQDHTNMTPKEMEQVLASPPDKKQAPVQEVQRINNAQAIQEAVAPARLQAPAVDNAVAIQEAVPPRAQEPSLCQRILRLIGFA